MLTRKSSGGVVFRFDDQANIEFLLVTSSSGKEWVPPKGGVEMNLSARQSAAKEIYEEAGVLVEMGMKLGDYRYIKNNQIQEVTMYAAQYVGEAADWPEAHKRERKWFKAKKAMAKVDQYIAPFLYDVVNNLQAHFAHEARKLKG